MDKGWSGQGCTACRTENDAQHTKK
jgi:hypothetical protein